MKKFLLILALCISSFCSVKAQQYIYSRQDALDIVMRKFANYDYDYYIYNDVENSKWQVLVDAEPMKGWEHKCYNISIPKTGIVPANSYQLRLFMQPTVSMPPSVDYEPAFVQNRYGSASTVKPLVKKTTDTNSDNTAASRTYAIIISGGGFPSTNYVRYWNDCSFIYQTLVNTYGIPKNNIYPIMSDGDDPGVDQNTPEGFKSQSLDLDFDGGNEQILAANRSNISQTLLQLSTKLKEDDHLFIYVIDHGGITPDNQSFIVLWQDARLFDYELANMLTPLLKNYVNVNVVLGQCHSGGFISELTKVGCVVATASAEDESSYSCGDIPFDEFVYHWTSAINGANHCQTKVNADTNGDGFVAMEEAFLYAKNNDRRDEHPQYNSTPLSVGEDLAFNRVVNAVDLYMQDNEEDSGKEPNLTTDLFWDSPAVCLRNENDDIFIHENPYYTTDHDHCYIYVKVHNRGKKSNKSGEKYLHLYWANASTGIRPTTWKGRETNNLKKVTGGHLNVKELPEIAPGENTIVKIGWSLPEIMDEEPGSQFHYCLCAKIMDLPYDDGYQDGVTYFNIAGKNDHVQKNVSIIRKEDYGKDINVYVRNVVDTHDLCTLEFRPRTQADTELFTIGDVEVGMSQTIYSDWESGGFQGVGIKKLTTPRRIKIEAANSRIEAIEMEPEEFDKISLGVDFKNFYPANKTYTFDLIQRNQEGEIIGGETFIVETPKLIVLNSLEITQTDTENGGVELSFENEDFTSVRWLNSKGERISDGSSIEVLPSLEHNEFTAQATTKDGEIAMGTITLKANNYFKSVNVVDNNIVIEFKNPVPDRAELSIVATTYSQSAKSQSVLKGIDKLEISKNGLKDGFYIITYSINGRILDQTKINL